jgi:hypothetical protein
MNDTSGNRLLKTLTDSIPEELIPNSPSGYSSVAAADPDSTSSSFLTIVMIIFGLVVVGFLLFYLAENSENHELKEFTTSIKQRTEPLVQSFLTSLNLETLSIKNLFKKRGDGDDDSDSGSDNGSDEESEKKLRPADGSQPELNPPYKNAPINVNNVPVNKNSRQYAQFNQMPGINSGKRVGQHFSSDVDEADEDNVGSLDAMLQNAASAAPGSLYSADDSNSCVQTKGKAGWCLIGEDKGVRNCIKVGANDTCLSGDIFPNNQICVNPNLRS